MTAPVTGVAKPRQPPGAAAGPLTSMLQALWRSPLTRNGYSLIASAGLTSVLGLVFWVVAARLYTADQVGVSAALISTLLTLGNISQLNFGNLLNRFLPVAGAQAGQLVWGSYLLVSAVAVLASVAFLLGIGGFVADLAFLHDSWWMAATFVGATLFWSIFALQDSVLTGLRRSAIVPVENAIYSIVKLALLPVLALYAMHLDIGVFVAWTLPLPIAVLIVNLIIHMRLLPAHSQANIGRKAIAHASMVKFFGWDYVGTLAIMIAMGVAPLLVLKTSGAIAIASYHLAWTICYPLYLISRSMSMSLLTEASSDPARMRALAVEAIVHSMLPLLGAVVVVLVGAPWIMMLFGSAYVEHGVALVRILVISTIPWGLVTIALAVLRAQGKTRLLAAAQVVTMLIVIGLGDILLRTIGEIGIGVAWLVAHTLVALGVLALLIKREGSAFIVGGLLQIAGSLASFLSSFQLPKKQFDLPPGSVDVIAELCASADLPDPKTWTLADEVATQSDVRTLFIRRKAAPDRPGDGPVSAQSAVLRFAISDTGRRALERNMSASARVRNATSDNAIGVAFPDVLATRDDAAGFWAIERHLGGQDGRQALLDPQQREQGLKDAVRIAERFHGATAVMSKIDGAWLSGWIDQNLDRVDQVGTLLVGAAARHRAIERIRGDQHAFWQGRQLPLGLGHGDYYAGNLLFDVPSDANAGQATSVAAIIDWEGLSMNAPPGLDAVHLAITTRSMLTGTEIGDVVTDFLTSPSWNEEELVWMAEATAAAKAYDRWPYNPETNRALVMLAWLLHVTTNPKKSERYSANRLWIENNIGRVLRAYDAGPR